MPSQVTVNSPQTGTTILVSFWNTEIGKIVNALNQIVVGTFDSANITTTGDISSRDVTTTRNVNIGNQLDIGSSTAVSAILDEDNMASNSAVSLTTQQSQVAYVATQLATQLATVSLSDILDYASSASSSTEKNQSDLKIAFGTISIGAASNQAITNLPFTSNTSYVIVLTGVRASSDLTPYPVVSSYDSGAQATLRNNDPGGARTVSWLGIGV